MRRRRAWSIAGIIGLLGAGLATLAATTPVDAHVPHDDIGAVVVSPDYTTDQTAVAIVRNRLMRTVDGGGSWQEMVNGIFGKNLEELVLDAADPAHLLLGTDGGGLVHSSTDGGTTWTQSSTGLAFSSVTEMAWSPTTAGLVFAAGAPSGVARSTDGGATWAPVGTFGRVDALAFTPSGTVLAGARTGVVSESTDGGTTWNPIYTVASGAGVNTIDAAPNGTDVTILVGTETGELFRSADGGTTFTAVGASLPADEIQSLVLSPDHATDQRAWLSTRQDGAHTSSDGGVTWTLTDTGLTKADQATQLGRAHFGELALAPNGTDPVIFLGGFDGLFRSLDGASTWAEQHTQVDYIVGLALSPDYANDQTLVVTTYVKGAYVSTDGGATWADAHVGLGFPRGNGNSFAAVKRLYNTEMSPDFANDDTMFLVNPNRFAISDDGGGAWTEIPVPSPNPPIRGPVIAVSPDYATDETIFLGTWMGEIHRSEQGGWSGWTLLTDLVSRIRSMVTSPAFGTDDTLFVGVETGVLKSTDRGVTWTPVGPTGPSPQLAISPDYATDGTVFAGSKSGLYVTTDGGTTWNPVVSGPLTATSHIEAVEVSPAFATDGVVLVSEETNGLLKSTDGGVTFAPTGADLLANNVVIADFNNPTAVAIEFSPSFATDQTVFGFGQQDVVKSTDGGATWQVLSLPPATEFLEPPDIVPGSGGTIAEDGSSGTTVQIPVDLSHPAIQTVTVDWATVDVTGDPDAASSSEGDFVAASGTLTFLEGDTRMWVDVDILDDGIAERDETITIALSNPVFGTIAGDGTATIVDDEPLPKIKPLGVVVNPEGDSGSSVHDVLVQLSHPSSTPVTADYTSLDVPGNPLVAASGTDYVGPFNGTITFAPGTTTATAPVEILGDTVDEPPLLWGEWGIVGFSNPSANATMDLSFFGAAIFIIIDDDP